MRHVMKITCENCNTRFVLDASRLPPQGARVRCSRCQHRFHVKPAPSALAPDEIAEKVVQDSAPEGPSGPLDAGDGRLECRRVLRLRGAVLL
jgi:predicted Zn finger-like uncharacterized protein